MAMEPLAKPKTTTCNSMGCSDDDDVKWGKYCCTSVKTGVSSSDDGEDKVDDVATRDESGDADADGDGGGATTTFSGVKRIRPMMLHVQAVSSGSEDVVVVGPASASFLPGPVRGGGRGIPRPCTRV